MSNSFIASVLQYLAIGLTVVAAFAQAGALYYRNLAQTETAALISMTIGKPWPRLSTTEIDKLAAALQSLPQHRVQLMYLSQLGFELASDINSAFKKAGWTNTTFSAGGGNHFGIIAGAGNQKAGSLKTALESSTHLKVELDKPDVPEWDVVYLFVGIHR